MFWLGRINLENWLVLRRRMLQETEVFLNDALRHPERQITIPARPVGADGFSPVFAEVFWAQVLTSS